MEKIDFVLLWVDGADPAWLEEKNRWSPVKQDYGTGDNRFRDWDNLQYWFRGVEKFAPWVNQIYFITWGHLPKWLNTEHPKLRVICHQDYIPQQYLPTFNSDTIETNLFRIKELSEHFVLFNDDMFLIDSTSPDDFFVNGMPRDSFVENLLAPVRGSGITHTKLVITEIINSHFKKRSVHKKFRRKIYSLKNGIQNLITLYFTPFSYFTGFRNPHLSQAHLKSTFDEVWKQEEEALDTSCRNRFRGTNDVSHWLMRYWNLCQGCFEPRDRRFGKYFEAGDDNTALCTYIRGKKGKVVCINDMSKKYNFEQAKTEINAALQSILDQKSAFEK